MLHLESPGFLDIMMAGTRPSEISCRNLARVAGEACGRSFGSRVRQSPVELLSPVDREAVRAMVLLRPLVDLRAVDVTGRVSVLVRLAGREAVAARRRGRLVLSPKARSALAGVDIERVTTPLESLA